MKKTLILENLCFYTLILKKKNQKIRIQIYKIQISNNYLKIINILYIFFISNVLSLIIHVLFVMIHVLHLIILNIIFN